METQKFNLCWNEFDKAASLTLKCLVEDQDFTDVTISCDDQQMQAHKIVLASSSCVFRRMLLKNAHPNPLIHLRGVNKTILKCVIEFMYLGQTEVDQNQLPVFMSVAKDLEIRGLSENLSSLGKSVEDTLEQYNGTEAAPADQDVEDMYANCAEEEEIEGPTHTTNEYPYPIESFTNSILTNDKIEERFYCDIENCDFRTKSTSHLKLHKKSVHEGIKHQCDMCDRSYNFPGDLRRHKKTAHEGFRYPCHFCDFSASQTQTLKNHMSKHHSHL